jgi:hypothetical protein
MRKISDESLAKFFITLAFAEGIVLILFCLYVLLVRDPVQEFSAWQKKHEQPTTSVTCAYDVTAKEKAAYVAGKTAAYQHMLATQCKKLNDTHPTQSQDCSKIDSDAVITDKQYGQSDEPQD